MKLRKLLALTMAMVLSATTGFAATSTGLLDVSADVVAACLVTDGTLALGSLDPTVGGDIGPIAAQTPVTIQCTNGTGFTVADDAAANPLTGPGSIAFTLSHLGTGTGTGSAVAYPISGSIVEANYLTQPAGTYTSTVTLTVTF